MVIKISSNGVSPLSFFRAALLMSFIFFWIFFLSLAGAVFIFSCNSLMRFSAFFNALPPSPCGIPFVDFFPDLIPKVLLGEPSGKIASLAISIPAFLIKRPVNKSYTVLVCSILPEAGSPYWVQAFPWFTFVALTSLQRFSIIHLCSCKLILFLFSLSIPIMLVPSCQSNELFGFVPYLYLWEHIRNHHYQTAGN